MAICPACSKELPGEFPFCPFCAAPLSARVAAGQAKERKVVSVLFCDLVGFTAASESADPEEVAARVAPYHARTRERIEAFGGTVEKFIGDAVMAVFGAPVAHEDDPERAVRAGLAILEAIEQLNGDNDSLALSVRVGVNTGEAVVALDARPELGEGMIAGDVVNTAARIQAQAPVDGVAVGEGTYRATDRVFEFALLAPISAKGKAEPVAVWQALRPTARFGSDVIRSMTTPLVGRDLEVTLLTKTFEKALQDRAVQLVTVVGEPGVGKSRLVAELFAYIDALDVLVRWRQGRCLPYGEGITFWGLREIVKAHAGIYETDSPEVATGKLEAVLPESADTPWLRARLLPLLGIDGGEAAVQEELFTAWRKLLESIAEQDPLVLVVEDIHWADPAMLAFLEHLADWAQGVPLLIVCTARPELYESHTAWGTGLRNQTVINLSPLSDTDTARLVSALLERAVLPAETQQLLLERAGGNPLYAEEFVRMLRDRDLLDEHGTLRSDAEVPFPESIQALIAARLDTLAQERKQLLQDAAVMGKVFWAGSTAVMGDREPREVKQALHELARKELVRPARHPSMEGEDEYGFWHLLVRDVAYNQIPRAQRASKHLNAASWLEQKAGERVEDLAEMLAYHTGEALTLAQATGDASLQAQITPAAARYALLAGERTLGLDTSKALDLLDRARALTSDTDPRLPLVLLRWAEAAWQSGRLRDAAAAVDQAADRFQAQGDLPHAGEALGLLSEVRRLLGEPGSLALGEQAVALLEPTPGPELVASLAQVSSLQFLGGAFEAAIATAGRALVLAAQLGLAMPGRPLSYRGLSRCMQGDLDGLTDIEHALELLIAAGKGRDAAILQHNLAILRWTLAGPAAAVSQFEQAETFAASRGLASVAQASRTASVAALSATGQLEQALERADAILPLLRVGGDRLGECELLSAQALALAEQGTRATEQAAQSAEIARDSGDPIFLALAAWGAAPALLAAGNTSAARALLDETAVAAFHHDPQYAPMLPALARAAHTFNDHDLVARLASNVPDTLPIQQHALATVQAIQAEQAGDHAQAASLYANAAQRWEQFTGVLEQAHALLGQGRCLTALADPEADQPLRQARALFDRMGARPRINECDTLIARASKLSS
jgi:class 3 adenylate cyclase/tetratricopeptide (TPR) repeat protein